jgi:hypothetical protein
VTVAQFGDCHCRRLVVDAHLLGLVVKVEDSDFAGFHHLEQELGYVFLFDLFGLRSQ